MCQITVSNLGSDILNKKLMVLMTSMGSTIHGDGWGIMGNDGSYTKCPYCAYFTTDLGKEVRNIKLLGRPLVAHIRKASPNVPITTENTHPFSGNDVMMIHNGTLVPKKPEEYVTKKKIPVRKVNSTTKIAEIKEEEVNISDSLLFFNDFIKSKITNDESFVNSVVKTVDKFYGKFAFAFYINNIKKTYVVRGKTARLYIMYLLESDKKDAQPIGYAINTDKNILELGCSILSNLIQLEGKEELIFSVAEEVGAEAIYRVDKTELVKIGEVKETSEPTSFSNWNYGVRFTSTHSPTNNTNTNSIKGKKELEDSARIIFEFQKAYSISLLELQYLFMALYGESLLEITEKELEHFCKTVIPALQKKLDKRTGKKIRRDLRKASYGYIGTYIYLRNENRYIFPWMLNSKERQLELLEEILSEKNS